MDIPTSNKICIFYAVYPNNTAVERRLRPFVVMRKITGGNRAPKGAHNHEVIISVISTWNKQNKDFFEEVNPFILTISE